MSGQLSMPKITYIEFNEAQHEVSVSSGGSLMEAAVDNDVPGIVAECGGSCSCATCHVYVDAAWAERLGPPSTHETDMLECVVDQQDNSRLSCQIQITDELDGLVVRLPEFQI